MRERLARVRSELQRAGIDALVVTSSDPHLSEYPPARWRGREWLTGFTGSAGTLVMTTAGAAVFVDGRYWAQADAELAGSGIETVRGSSSAGLPYCDWLVDVLPRGARVAIDGDVVALVNTNALRDRLARADITLVSHLDPLDAAWCDRPTLPSTPVRAHAPPHATRTRTENLGYVRSKMAEHAATHHVISTLDDVAWLLNLRGADVDHTPVFVAHLLLSADEATVFMAPGKVPRELVLALDRDGVRLADYGSIKRALGALPDSARVLLDPRRVAFGLRAALPEAARIIEATNPSTLAKARKNEAEVEFVRETMVEDGAAMCRFYAAFEASLAAGDPWDECLVHERLTAERARSPLFVSLSFDTIAGYNANGALPHYRAVSGRQARIEGGGMLLVDSGGQYLGGTTDVTRVWPIGRPTAAMKRDVTLVLKALIALSTARFPRGIPAPSLDALARAPLWSACLDYGHGTGHGVGYFLNVHESPPLIARISPEPEMALHPGMVTSIEPGIYRPERWGVRLENLVLARSVPGDREFGEFLEFETMTLCPIDSRLLDSTILDEAERRWLDGYHAIVRERLGPRLEGASLTWLRARTEPLA